MKYKSSSADNVANYGCFITFYDHFYYKKPTVMTVIFIYHLFGNINPFFLEDICKIKANNLSVKIISQGMSGTLYSISEHSEVSLTQKIHINTHEKISDNNTFYTEMLRVTQ